MKEQLQMKISERIAELAGAGERREWSIETEPHDYPDGTKQFTHVVYTPEGWSARVRVGEYVTPELAELMCLLHNNLDEIVAALRTAGK